MAVVVKVSTEEIYKKVVSINETIKSIKQEMTNLNHLQAELAQKYWGGDAATYNFLEHAENSKQIAPILIGMSNKANKLYMIGDTYDKVEGYNKHAEAGMLPENFID